MKWSRKYSVITIVCLIIFILCYGVYWGFYDMKRLPEGEFISEEHSPDGTYTLKTYLVNDGATTSFAIRGEIQFNKKSKKAKNIYWNYREEEVTVEWIDDETVVINGRELNVIHDKFDWRRK